MQPSCCNSLNLPNPIFRLQLLFQAFVNHFHIFLFQQKNLSYKFYLVRDAWQASKSHPFERLPCLLLKHLKLEINWISNYFFIALLTNQVKFKSLMLRKGQKPVKKSARKKIPTKKLKCSACEMKLGLSIHIQNALSRKYSSYNFFYADRIEKMVGKNTTQQEQQRKQCMEKYYRKTQRKHEFPKLKQIYKLYKEVPRIFHANVQEIVSKCHHRKRLLEYFRLAKVLGLKVQSVKLSTFLLSLSKSEQNPENSNYERIIGEISGYDFTEEIERQILEAMGGKGSSHLPVKNLKIQVQ